MKKFIKINCKNCNVEFEKDKYEYDNKMKKSKINFFCSLSCSVSFHQKNKKLKNQEDYDNNPNKCHCCDSPLSYEKRKNKFCNHICSLATQGFEYPDLTEIALSISFPPIPTGPVYSSLDSVGVDPSDVKKGTRYWIESKDPEPGSFKPHRDTEVFKSNLFSAPDTEGMSENIGRRCYVRRPLDGTDGRGSALYVARTDDGDFVFADTSVFKTKVITEPGGMKIRIPDESAERIAKKDGRWYNRSAIPQVFVIAHLQRDYKGDIVYRVYHEGDEEDFGRPASPEDVIFV